MPTLNQLKQLTGDSSGGTWGAAAAGVVPKQHQICHLEQQKFDVWRDVDKLAKLGDLVCALFAASL